MRIGLISDTHGLLRPEARAALRGVDHIIHAGDIGSAALLAALEDIAPVDAVRGNNDGGAWAASIPETLELQFDEARVYVIHDLALLDIDPAERGFRVVIAGHSHKPFARETAGVLYVNPGSAGPRRFKLPISLGQLHVAGRQVHAELTTLEISR